MNDDDRNSLDFLMNEYSLDALLTEMADRALWYSKQDWQIPPHILYWQRCANILRTAQLATPQEESHPVLTITEGRDPDTATVSEQERLERAREAKEGR